MTNMLVIVPDHDYASNLSRIVKESEEAAGKTLYVSFNKTYKSLVENLGADGIDTNRFFFIDTISATIIKPAPVNNCLFLTDPNDMKKLYSAIIKSVKERKAEMLIFDSLSCMTTYGNQAEIEQFITTLLAALSLLNCPSAFICMRNDENNVLITHMKMKVDKTIEI
jgi:archaellum biogenesis ATPase FlaH